MDLSDSGGAPRPIEDATLDSTELLAERSSERPRSGEMPMSDVAPIRPRRPGGDEAPSLPARYDDLGVVAHGSFGEVRRVRDTLLDRVLAMKILRSAMGGRSSVRRRFFAEVQITAQLQHPGIVPVYDHGELADGRLWYAMKEVRGVTLGRIIAEIHGAASPGEGGVTPSGWTFRRAIDAFARIAQTVAYAHRSGVVHRDLKPENLMAGELGEVHVMDWGLARRITCPADEGDEAVDSIDAPVDHQLTLTGDVLGTPAYMPPEQASGARDLHGPHSDVYSLGAVLYHLLAGRPPYLGEGADIVRQIRSGPPAPLLRVAAGGAPIPEELARACERALSRDIDGRGTAEGLAAELLAWLDGARRREQAESVLAKARAIEPEIARLRDGSERSFARARALLAEIRPFDPVEVKRPAWQLEDEAAQLRVSAALAETRWLEAVHAALAIDGELPGAHAMLADHYRAEMARAERAHLAEDAARFEELLRVYDRGAHTAFLRGEGAITLVTDPPGATVSLHRYVLSDRRLTPIFERELGVTPLVRAPVQRGSYLLVARAPGCLDVRIPVLVERDGHWDGVAPGGAEPHPIVLPRIGELGPDDVYVPAGWCWTGGDPAAIDSLPARRIWVDAFVIRRAPVTQIEYTEFLNELVASGRGEEAVAAAPWSNLGPPGSGESRAVHARSGEGRFLLPGEGADPAWQPEMPVVQIDWNAACAYAEWLARKTGEAWRLPHEIEREKAARGVDGRLFPWGDHGDPTFARVIEGHGGPPGAEPAGRHPVDESPYGIRGLAGNVRDWCSNLWTPGGPAVRDGRLHVEPARPGDPEFRAVRGGFWSHPLANGRSSARFGVRPDLRRFSVGLRPARSLRGRARE